MALPRPLYITVADYFALERDSEIRHEYVDGQIDAMSGASRDHNRIVLDVGTQLNVQTAGGPCEVYVSDMRVQVLAGRTYRYPDAIVVCGEPDFAPTQPETLLNPTVLVEVLSDSTESVDRAQKFREYTAMPSVRAYLLVSQREPRVEMYTRHEAGWLYTDTTGLEATVTVPSIGCTLALADVYARVTFDNEEADNNGEA